MSAESVTHDIERDKVPQYGLGTIVLMFAWPAAWFTLLIYVVGRQFIPEGGTTPTWLRLLIVVLGTGAELVAGLVLLRREGYRLTLGALRDRIRLRWPTGWKAWTLAAVVFVLGMSLSMAIGPVNRALASVPGFVPPEWWGAASNPTVKVTGAADVFPDITLQGNYLFALLYIVIGFVFNIVGEETYYRGYLLPRMRGAFGRWDWVANGVLFTLNARSPFRGSLTFLGSQEPDELRLTHFAV